MIGLEDDCLLALVNDNNKVIGSVSFSEYKKSPKKYKILTLRVIVVSEENEFILSKYRKIINNNKELYSRIIIQERTLEGIP